MGISEVQYKNAGVEKWQITYQLSPSGALTIYDQFKLSKIHKANQLNFMIWGKPDMGKPGEVVIEKEGKRVKLLYDKNLFNAVTEVIPQTDTRLS